MKRILTNLYYLVYEKRKLVLLLGFTITLSSLFEAVGVGWILPLVDILQNEEAVLKYNKYIVALGFSKQDYRGVVFSVTIGFACLILLKNIFGLATIFVSSIFQNLVKSSLSTKIFSNYLAREYNFFVVTPQGNLVQRLTSVVDETTKALSLLTNFIINSVTICFVYLVFILVSIKLTLFITLIIAVLSVIVAVISRYRAYYSGKITVKLGGELYSIAAETIGGMRIVRAFGAESYIKNKFTAVVNRLARIHIINSITFAFPAPVIETMVVLGFCGFILKGAGDKNFLNNMIPTLSMFAVGLMRIMQKVSIGYVNMMRFANFLPSVDAAVELMRDLTPVETKHGKRIAELNKGIYFNKVNFAYPQAPEQKVLNDVTLRIACSKFTAIVGPSGSGKSTIVDLLLGLYRPTQGEILIDDQDRLDSFDIGSLRKRIGFVGQETILFNATVSENISFAASEINMERIENSAKLANAYDFISKLPQGYNTEIGERGLKLSGGERQRLAIARALYRDPEILIFDEATSALDTRAEKEVQSAIENLKGDRTLIVIAHRLSTILKADWIYVINNGKVVEEGTHENLLNHKGMYRELCLKQDLGMNE